MEEDRSDVLEGTEIGAMHRGEVETSCAANPFSVAMLPRFINEPRNDL
jgi:hypothetical protein